MYVLTVITLAILLKSVGLFTVLELSTYISICSIELRKSGFKYKPLKAMITLYSIDLISLVWTMEEEDIL